MKKKATITMYNILRGVDIGWFLKTNIEKKKHFAFNSKLQKINLLIKYHCRSAVMTSSYNKCVKPLNEPVDWS